MGNFENIVVFIRLQVHLYKIGFIQNIESHLYLNQLQQQPNTRGKHTEKLSYF